MIMSSHTEVRPHIPHLVGSWPNCPADVVHTNTHQTNLRAGLNPGRSDVLQHWGVWVHNGDKGGNGYIAAKLMGCPVHHCKELLSLVVPLVGWSHPLANEGNRSLLQPFPLYQVYRTV